MRIYSHLTSISAFLLKGELARTVKKKEVTLNLQHSNKKEEGKKHLTPSCCSVLTG